MIRDSAGDHPSTGGVPPQLPVERLRSALSGWGERLDSMPAWQFCAVVGVVAVARIGPAGVGPNFLKGMYHAADSWPVAVNTLQSSPGFIMAFRALGTPSAPVWWSLGIVLWLATWASVMLLLSRRGTRGRVATVALAATPAFAVTVSMLGHYDMLLVLGSLVVALGRSRIWAVIGAVVATSGNIEQAAVAALAFTLVALAAQNREALIRGLSWLTIAVASFLLVTLIMPTSAEMMSRTAALGEGGMVFGVRLFGAAWPLAIYAFLGPLWIPVILRIAHSGSWLSRGLMTFGLIVLPAAASVATLDGTRVFAITGLAALLLAARTWRSVTTVPPWALGLALVALIVSPSIVTMPEPSGLIRLPWNELMSVAGWPIDWSLRR